MTKRGRPKKQSEITYKCMCCGADIDIKEVVKSNKNNHLFKGIGVIPICIDCLENIYQQLVKAYSNYENPEKKAMEHLCSMVDWYYTDRVFDKALADFEREKEKYGTELKFIRYYVKHIKLRQYSSKTYFDAIMERKEKITNLPEGIAIPVSADAEKEKKLQEWQEVLDYIRFKILNYDSDKKLEGRQIASIEKMFKYFREKWNRFSCKDFIELMKRSKELIESYKDGAYQNEWHRLNAILAVMKNQFDFEMDNLLQDDTANTIVPILPQSKSNADELEMVLLNVCDGNIIQSEKVKASLFAGFVSGKVKVDGVGKNK